MFNKDSILRRIQDFYDLSNRGALAVFLGVSPSTLSNWITRDTIDYELIFSKCKELNYEYILTGEGLMLKRKSDLFLEENVSPIRQPNSSAQINEMSAQLVGPTPNTNLVTEQSREVELLTQFIKAQEALLNSKAELLQAKDDIIEGKDAVIAAKEAQLANITKRAEELTAQLNDLKKQHPSVSKGTASGVAVRK